jgi:copper chaperone
MTVFTIPDMSCDGCVASITRAVQQLHPGVSAQTILATHQLASTSQRSAAELAAATDDAGYIVQAA